MPSPICVYIEMPSYLKKYLISQSENRKEPLEFIPEHDYSLLLTRLTTNRPVENISHQESTIKIRLPFNRGKDVYFYNKIGINKRKYFREQVRLDFYYDFRLFIKERMMAGIQRKIAIEQFFNLHGITEDDIKYESFYRNFTRYNDKKIRKFNDIMISQRERSICQY
jgi:hypothetical protein